MKPDAELYTRTPRNDRTVASCEARRTVWSSLQWWPGLAGVAFAAFVAVDLFDGKEQGTDLAPIVAASGLVYLAAAALQKPSMAWPVFFLSVAVITAAKMGLVEFDATWMLVGLAVFFAVLGVLRGKSAATEGLALQTVGMAGFGTLAAIALLVNGAFGAYLVAGGLLAHAAWDVYHHWSNKVVIRSLAEFCFVLDTLLALIIVFVTARG